LSGIFLGLFVPKPIQDTEHEKNCRIVGILFLGLYVLLGVTLFYTVVELN